jgi:uncharacterized membrane protein
MQSTDKKLARFLGGFSAVLGVPMTFMTRRFLRFIGVDETPGSVMWTRIVGVREHGPAIGLLVRKRPVGWLWARVAGDVMDLVLLGASMSQPKERRILGMRLRRKQPDRGRQLAATGGVVATLGLDTLAAVSMSRTDEQDPDEGPEHVKSAITVWRSPDETYSFWHDFTNLPRFMAHLESVEPAGNGHSHWKAKAPIRGTVEWDAEVVEDLPGRLIAWRSTEDADVDNSGTVRFDPAPGGHGTEIRVDMRYAAPAGPVGATLAKLFGEEPRQQVEDDLRRFKQLIEAGEITRSDGSPEGTLARRQARQRPAQPPKKPIASTNGSES